jgi:hypothetical protein
MKVLQLTAENFKKIKAIVLKPDPYVQEISGANGAGKSSALDAIWAALGGAEMVKASGTSQPIRNGEKKAMVALDLGDMIVTRRWTAAGSTVTVENKDGARYPSPQAILDGLIGRVSLDPLSFANSGESAQRATLLSIVKIGIDLEKNAVDRKAAYDARADINREIRAMGELQVIEKMDHVSIAELASKKEAIRTALNDQWKANKAKNQEMKTAFDVAVEKEKEAIVEFNRVQNERSENIVIAGEAVLVLRKLGYQGKEAAEWFEAMPKALDRQNPDDLKTEQPAYIDERPDDAELKAVDAEILSSMETNRRADQYDDYQAKVNARKSKQEASENWTKTIENLDNQRDAAIAAASFPVPGLSFNETGVLYNGLPFSQCSSAEKLRVSVAIAMATSPKLRVIRITDGSLIDKKNMAILDEMAHSQDYQLLIEKVDESGKIGVYIEDGEIKANSAN